jgi:two-component system sensor histidine kinase BaeS
LLVAVVVSLLAVGATAVIAQRVASDDLRRALDQELASTDEILGQIEEHVFVEGGWDDVDELVEELAGDTGTRIAIIDDFGRRVADSDPAEALPSQPTGHIDTLELLAGPDDVDLIDEIYSRCDAAAFAAAGLPADGQIDRSVTPEPEDYYPEDYYPEDYYPEIFDTEVFDTEDYDTEAYYDAFTRCAATTQVEIGVPPSALIYLGVGDATAASLLGSDGPDARLIVVALAVVVTATGIAALGIRPVVAQVGALQRGAAHLGRGRLDTRVPESGTTELAELAATFNHMAGSLQAEDERRRRWTSDVAHELRSPLQNLRGHLESAQDGLMDTDGPWFDSVLEEIEQLSHLVEDLQILTLADGGRLDLDRRRLDLGELAADVVSSHQARASLARISLEARGSADAEVDERRMRQVIGNLLDNALRHTPAGGQVEVSVTRAGSRARVVVSDSGEGIPADALPTLFDRFSRVDTDRSRARGGSGLGLAIVAGLVDAHDGTVRVESAPGSGTSFSIEI